MIKEIWLSIKHFEGLYEISNKGHVRQVGYHFKSKKGCGDTFYNNGETCLGCLRRTDKCLVSFKNVSYAAKVARVDRGLTHRLGQIFYTGEIVSLDSPRDIRLREYTKSKIQYVLLQYKGVSRQYSVRRLVAQAFIDCTIDTRTRVRSYNNDPLDNRVENLYVIKKEEGDAL